MPVPDCTRMMVKIPKILQKYFTVREMHITVTYIGITVWYVGMDIYALSDKVSPAIYTVSGLYCPRLYFSICIFRDFDTVREMTTAVTIYPTLML